jgi:dTDP-4-amino-4,6-dideoxygalactose transaminase
MAKEPTIYLSAPDITPAALERVKDVFASNWIAPLGPEVDGFEQDLSSHCRRASTAVVTSGTSAIHLALRLLGVGPGDTVIVPTFSFIASANPVAYLGATPVFVDSEHETWNICPELLKACLVRLARQNKLPKAVMAVDLYGMPAKFNELLVICEEYSIPLIEDAAEALGSFYHDKPAGSFGTCSILSFNGNKIITTSGGGALLSNDHEFIKKARFLATQARDPAPHYQHSEIGYNYRMSNVLAAIGRAELAHLEKKVAIRRAHFDFYRQELEPYGVVFPEEPSAVRTNRWLTTALFPHETFGTSFPDSLRIHLSKYNIETRPLWKPLHLQPVFEDCSYHGERCAQELFDQGLCLPSGSGLTREQVVSVIGHMKELLESRQAIAL